MAKQTKAHKARTGVTQELISFSDAIKLVKDNAKAKFDESIEIAVNLGVDPRHADQQVRGVVSLPSGTGRDVRVAVFAKDAKAAEATAAGAEHVGAEDLYEKINGGFMDFDRVIASPDMMALVGRLGKVLGPRGLMPNPKVGTVTPNVAQAVKDAKGGAVEFRVEKAGIAHGGIGNRLGGFVIGTAFFRCRIACRFHTTVGLGQLGEAVHPPVARHAASGNACLRHFGIMPDRQA